MTTYKRPNEVVPFAVDFARVMPDGEHLQNSSTVKIFDVNGIDVTADMVEAVSVTGTKVNAIVKSGADMADYLMVFTANTELYTFEEEVILKVRLG